MIGTMVGWSEFTGAIAAVDGIVAVATAGVTLFGRQRKRVTYQVEYDSPVAPTPDVDPRLGVKITRDSQVLDELRLADLSLVLLRVRNAGTVRVQIPESNARDPLKFQFPGREALLAVTSDASTPALDGRLRDSPPQRSNPPRQGNESRGEVALPNVMLKRRDKFKVLVLLRGRELGVVEQGFIPGGSFDRDRGGRRRLIFVGTGAALSLALTASLLWALLAPATVVPFRCVRGRLLVEGSSGFSDVVSQIADQYDRSCSGSHITVTPVGSVTAVQDLDRIGTDNPEKALSRLAMSGGLAPPVYRSLVQHPIGVNVSAVVVNKRTDIHDLTLDQLRGIYEGRYRNWSELGGSNMMIKIVSRGANSGTRLTFEQKLLGHAEKLAVSSNDCINGDRDPRAPMVRCERATTTDLLTEVNKVPGAIGYSGLWPAEQYPNINIVRLNGVYPDIAFVKERPATYAFWTVEYFYTYGSPGRNTLLSAFLEYMSLDPADTILQRDGYSSCTDPQNHTLCYS
ncbi:MAG: PstS family phosphate ABC transporter substrate-binding protein [Frankia sp.]